MAKACIICAKTVTQGRRVEDDMVISSIRAVKQKLGIAKNNELVVCHDCFDAYRKRRGEYEKRLVQHIIIASVILLIFVLLPLFTTGFSLWSVVLGIIFAAGVMLLSVFAHCPKADVPAEAGAQGAKAAPAPAAATGGKAAQKPKKGRK